MKKTLLITSFICLLTACNKPLKGIIIKKEISQERVDTMYEPVIQTFTTRTYPKQYQITIKSDKYNMVYDVTESEYNNLKIGDEYVYGCK